MLRFLRRALLPPRTPEMPGAEVMRFAHSARATLIFIAILGDLLLWQSVRDPDQFRVDAADAFAVINIGLLSVDFIITLLFLRRWTRWYQPLLSLCICLEMFTAIVWVQLTGTVSSYFIAAGPLMAITYRLAFTWSVGFVAVLSLIVFHIGAYALEQAGVLRQAGLFATELGGAYTSDSFRATAMISLIGSYAAVFVGANTVATLLRDKEQMLAAARRAAAEQTEVTGPGRLSGREISDYLIGELLGRGGMGEVYAAHRRRDGREVAIKVLHPHHGSMPEMRERLRREAAVLARLSGALVARALEFGVTPDGCDYIVMERLHGEDLNAYLRRSGRLPPAEIADLLDRIAFALDVAHQAGIVHRDLKPQNVFLGSDGQVRLLDFGLSRLEESTGELTRTAAILGTAGYLAPEQARGDGRDLGPHTDVFALGAILYKALTGENAFPSRNVAAAVMEALERDPPPPSSRVADIPPDIDDVIALALAKKIGNRYASAGAVAADFRRALSGELAADTRARARALRRPGGIGLEDTLSPVGAPRTQAE